MSQSLSQSYGSIWPTSLTYVRLREPWAAHPGDLLRFLVRRLVFTGIVKWDMDFFRNVAAAPDHPLGSGSSLEAIHFANQLDSVDHLREKVNKKRKLSPGAHPIMLVHFSPTSVTTAKTHNQKAFRNKLGLIPFRSTKSAFTLELRTDSPVAKYCAHGTFPHQRQSSSVSPEYLLLPPRSAPLGLDRLVLTNKLLVHQRAHSTSYWSTTTLTAEHRPRPAKRHPF